MPARPRLLRERQNTGVSGPIRLYLGVDGGQSSTTALIADENGSVLGSGRSGPCNHVGTPEGRAKFLTAVGDCLDQACRSARLDPSTVTFASACLGFSGGAEDKEAYSRELIRAEKYKITHDAEIALSGATEGEPGIIVIAGTGSMAFGRDARNRTARAGGWGYVFGDEGGAFDLARQALRAALQYEEGWGPPTNLHALLLDATQTRDANELLHRFYTADYSRTRIASFAPLVTQAAENGDVVAQAIVTEAAAKLTSFVAGVYHHLFYAQEKVAVAHIGGVFQSKLLRGAFVRAVRDTIGCLVRPPRLGPAAGALLGALRLDGNYAQLRNVPEFDK